jgi:hypothetical protein
LKLFLQVYTNLQVYSSLVNDPRLNLTPFHISTIFLSKANFVFFLILIDYSELTFCFGLFNFISLADLISEREWEFFWD